MTENLPPGVSTGTCRKPQGSDARRDASLKALTGSPECPKGVDNQPLPRRGAPSASPKDLLALRMCVWYSLESFTCTVAARCRVPAGAGTTLLSLWDLTGYSWSLLQGLPLWHCTWASFTSEHLQIMNAPPTIHLRVRGK